MAQKSHRGPGPSGGMDAGPSQRQLRVGELIRRRLAEVFARGEVHDPDLAGMVITVGEVSVSPDLRHALAYVLPLGGKGREKLVETLMRNRVEIRRAVTEGLALKFSPDLKFAVDETFDRLDETRRMFADERVKRDLERD